MTDEQTNNLTNWLEEESKTLNINSDFGERLPSLKLEVGKVTKFTVDFSKPFNKWNETKNGKTLTKAIIPVLHKGEKKNLWLNVKNPLYGQLIEAGKNGQTEFSVSTTGTQADTRYAIVTED
ncbi:MAG: hypothetical protein WC346_04560 [Methanogenium sp.]|jgi:hypothetical protein